MNATKRVSADVRKMVYLAILTAIVFVLQYIALFMRFSTFSITFVLVPMVIGVALCGKWSGVWLGFVFGLAVFATGDAAYFLTLNIPGTIITVMLKGMLAGLFAGLVYSLIEKKNRYCAVIASAITAPVVNTGVFILGCFAFFFESISVEAGSTNAFVYILTAYVGINFFIELGINIVLSPVILRIIDILKKQN